MSNLLNTSSGSLAAPLRKRRSTDDNMIPLINIVFLLLIFFMVAGQVRATPDARLRLPEAKLEKPQEAIHLRLEMMAPDDYRLNGQVRTLDEIQSWLASQPEQQQLALSLFADREVRAADLEDLLASLRPLQLQSIRLYAELPVNSGEQP